MLSIWRSRHSRRLRAPTPAGSSDCTTLQCLLDVRQLVLAYLSNFFQRGGEIPVLVQVTDHGLGRVAYDFGDDADAQLRPQMVAKRDRGGKKRLEGRLLDRLRGRGR